MNDQVNTEDAQFGIPEELRRKAGEPVPFQTEADKGKDAVVVKP